MNSFFDYCAVFFVLIVAYEVANLAIESRKQRSFSLVFKAIVSIKNYVKIRFLVRNEELKMMAGIDTYGTLGHLLFIFVFVVSGSFLFNQIWFIIVSMVLVGISLSIVLWDMMFWIGASVGLFFESLFRVIVNRSMIVSATNSQDEKRKLNLLIDQVKNIKLGDILPSFITRFVFVVMLVVIGFAFEYMQLSRLDSFSFLDRSGGAITSFMEFLYQSVMITTTLGADMQPSQWGKFILSCHAVITLYLFVVVLAFFATLSENKLEIEKANFFSNLNAFSIPLKEVKK